MDLLYFINGTGDSFDELILKANWHQLSMDGSDEERDILPMSPPRSLLHVLQKNLNQWSSDEFIDEAKEATLHTLLNISTKTSGGFNESLLLRHRLLTHWSFAISQMGQVREI